MSIFREFNISMIPGKPPLIIHVSQYESDFVYTFHLVSGKNVLAIPDTAIAVIRGTKRDGNGFSKEASLDTENNKVVVIGEAQMTACAGKNVFELAIINDEKIICTANFFLDVERAPLDAGTIQSETVLHDLQAIINSAATATQAAEEASASAESAASAAEQAVEEKFEDGVAETIDEWLTEHPEATTTVQDEAVTTAKLANNTVTEPKLASNSVSSAKIQDGAITTTKLNSEAVTTEKISDGAITEVKLASSSVSTAKLQDGAVTEGKLADALKLKVIKDYVTPEMFGAVGDGVTDDTQAIQSAIDYMYNHGGGVVVVPPSDNPYIFTQIQLKEGVTLKGAGGVLKLKDNVCVSSSISYYLIYNTDDNCIYDGLIIDGNSANNELYTVADSITCQGENSVIKNCRIYNSVDSAIMFSHVKNAMCINNMIDGARDAGIYINDGDGTNSNDNVVSGNVITNVESGIVCKRISQRFIISNNAISKCDYGITHEQASAADDFGKNNIIADNFIRNVKISGIILRGSPYCVVSGNRVESVLSRGIVLEGNTHHASIIGNVITQYSDDVISGTYNAGIFICEKGNYAPSFNVISGNNIDVKNMPAIRALKVVGAFSNGGNYNNINSNNVYGANIAVRMGADFTKNLFIGNVLNGSSYDIYFDNGCAGNLYGDNVLVNNTSINLNNNLFS